MWPVTLITSDERVLMCSASLSWISVWPPQSTCSHGHCVSSALIVAVWLHTVDCPVLRVNQHISAKCLALSRSTYRTSPTVTFIWEDLMVLYYSLQPKLDLIEHICHLNNPICLITLTFHFLYYYVCALYLRFYSKWQIHKTASANLINAILTILMKLIFHFHNEVCQYLISNNTTVPFLLLCVVVFPLSSLHQYCWAQEGTV